jgi:hypothetical protein
MDSQYFSYNPVIDPLSVARHACVDAVLVIGPRTRKCSAFNSTPSLLVR